MRMLQEGDVNCCWSSDQMSPNMMCNYQMQKQKGNTDRGVGITGLESVVTKLLSTPEESKYCMCNICLEKHEQRSKGITFLRESASMFKIELSKLKKFYQFLSAVDHKIFFKMQMPELCFFENGEGRILFKTKGQAFIQIHLTPEMKKQIPNIFIDNRRSANNTPAEGEMDVHIKHFQAVVPSFKHGLSKDNPENKPRHFTFHSNQKEGEDNYLYKAHHNPDKEVAIVKYKDKNLELLSEKQLRWLLKSNNNKIGSIELIQSFVKPYDRESEFICGEYLDYLKPLNALMFNRSLVQMKTEIGLISKYSKDYIPMELLEEYEQMLKEMPEEYCLYQTYKMVHYIEINRDVKVKRLNTVWFKDEFKELNFFGIMQFSFEENEKVNADLEHITELKDIMQTELTDLEKELLRSWEDMKKRKMQEYTRRIANEPLPQVDEKLEKIKQEFQNRKAERKSTSPKRRP